jgi:hypothetical protein
MAKITLTDVSGGYLSVVTFNANNTLIEQAMENTLSRNGLSPNQMEANLDMNSNYIRNLADGINQQDAVTLSQLQDVVASGGGTTAANVTITDAGGLYTSNNVEGALQEISTTYATSTLETTNGVTPTDLSYNYGDVRRYGAVADAVAGVGGTDNTTAFQDAVDSGHPVYIPEGYYAIEGTVNVWGGGGATGGPSITGTAWTRLEKFTNANSDPIMVLAGTTVSLNGEGMTFAAREYGGYTKGLVRIGANPTAVDETDVSVLDMTNCMFRNFRVLGNTTTGGTGTDASVGIYIESPARRRGVFITPDPINVYYNNFSNIYSTQWDYCWFLSTDTNANTFTSCTATKFGHGGFYVNGYGNQFMGCRVESGILWDTRERGCWVFGNKNDGPEGSFGDDYLCDEDCTQVAISAISKGSVTTFTTATHGLTTGNKVLIRNIVDSGPNGDLEDALNEAQFSVTVTSGTQFTVNLDTSSLTNTYVSGGNVHINAYAITGAFRNHVCSYAENAYNASTSVIRGFLTSRPKGAYSSEKVFNSTYGTNHVMITGTLSGGVGRGGTTTRQLDPDDVNGGGILNNSFWAPAASGVYGTVTKMEEFEVQELDDSSGYTYGDRRSKQVSARLTGIDESTAYDFFVWDDAGPTGACGMITLSFAGKVSGSATEQNHVGEIKWALFNKGGTKNAVQLSRLESDDGDGHPVEFSLVTADGTSGAAYGKFTVRMTTNSLTGTNNTFYYVLRTDIVTSQLDGSNLDWEADLTMLNGDQGAGP